MSRDQIISGLKELLAQQKQLKADLSTLTEATRLADLGFDSITLLEFLYELETRFQVCLEVADLIRMERVRDLVDHLERHAGAA
ncbi:MAG: Phosphopantetheine attachment site [Verrucomicrobiota bacterium]|jgi:acyl carrier protein